ncbi:TPA: hypothetical protein IBZ97_004183 [Escherichia coli]|uniref:hypothetical protein n=1 Tax=Escherichia coli TaxID=562 RepID=UPI000BE2EAA4|nr:hypothetical protein [Escherichia coli]HCO5692315.1 hypothetical protein [Escherichia fergusonii]EFK7829049.1 hypothetical protein [Escherichia coli]HAM5078431.1 hypothetical protein [Escherichia coli]HBE4863831.1 hypothetical protein [Escherichia coli]HBN0989903.1 hypothetical protein [Escherichia coli]
MDGESFNFDNTDIEFLASMYASAKLSANTSPIMHIIVSIPRDKKKHFYDRVKHYLNLYSDKKDTP